MYNSCVFHGIVGTAVYRTVFRLNSTHAMTGRPRSCQIITDAKRNCRQLHDKAGSSKFILYNLTHRTLLKLQGKDTRIFLQGLITNDIERLAVKGEQRALYAHMLNVQGRTLFDVIIYSLTNNEEGECSVLLECDSTVTDSLQKHLKVYKIRRKVTVAPCSDLSLWAVMPQGGEEDSKTADLELTCSTSVRVWEADPRVAVMGWRLVVDKQVNPQELIPQSQQGDIDDYHRYRYTIGLSEGVEDLPLGVALPLESNLVYMNGVSFTKGCYIGQELTARTHHTGVIRKRLMPVRLSGPVQEPEKDICTASGKSAGKYRAGLGSLGLALIRLAHANEQLILQSSEGVRLTLKASVPNWWPKDQKSIKES
ncbi:putative transferase CAF17 homolog, mitochondrial [Lepisosteus oculatus]|uniref:putative transferase CAF17 homolog, mitochondrial n=1 Tax=Lepisosteus oculatus TaxID=7918 RepID=UPI003718EFC8